MINLFLNNTIFLPQKNLPNCQRINPNCDNPFSKFLNSIYKKYVVKLVFRDLKLKIEVFIKQKLSNYSK